MTTFKIEPQEELPPYVSFTFGYKRGLENLENATYSIMDDEGLNAHEVARWLNRAFASSGIDALQVIVKP